MAGSNLGELSVLTPAEWRREARQARLIERALAEGYRGLGVLIWADGVIAAVSAQGHAVIETSLAELCREHPVSVLCVYDRGGAGTRQLDMAVAHHPDELRDQQAFVHHDRHRLALGGEFDISNLDVLSTALRTLTAIGATGAPCAACSPHPHGGPATAGVPQRRRRPDAGHRHRRLPPSRRPRRTAPPVPPPHHRPAPS